jgi:NhaA family Na+:H+ antiporter
MTDISRSRVLSRLQTRARSAQRARALLPLPRFLRLGEIAGGPLLIAAVIALIWANLPGDSYAAVWDRDVTLSVASVSRTEPLKRWVTDVLLPVFFLVAGLEIKREVMHGELHGWRRAAFPLAVATGGMLVPLGVYLAMTWGRAGSEGWAVPVATDIAFALAVLAVLGNRVPRPVKVLTLAFAAIDDMGATLIIAVFHNTHINLPTLGVAAGFLALIMACRFVSVRGELIYWLLGAGFVASVLHGGIHSTVAGLTLGLLAPSRPLFSRAELVMQMEEISVRITELDEQLSKLEASDESQSSEGNRDHDQLVERQEALLAELEELTVGYESPVDRELRRVTPWVSYTILPIFALANAGVPVSTDALASTVSLGPGLAVMLALVVGKPVGFLVFAWLALTTGVAHLPEGVSWRHLAIVGMLAGIGFTMSLFIAQLAFSSGEQLDQVKIAILTASATAALIGGAAGYLLLKRDSG